SFALPPRKLRDGSPALSAQAVASFPSQSPDSPVLRLAPQAARRQKFGHAEFLRRYLSIPLVMLSSAAILPAQHRPSIRAVHRRRSSARLANRGASYAPRFG